MTPQQIRKLERELGEYIDWLTNGMGRPERREAMGLYLTGLLLDGDRKKHRADRRTAGRRDI